MTEQNPFTRRINWKWPSNGANGLLPWYVIIKNSFAIPFMFIAALSLLVFFAIVYGPHKCVAEVKRTLGG